MSLVLLHRPALIVHRLLINLGAVNEPGALSGGTLVDWSAYCGSEPDAPDQVVTVYNTTEKGDGRHMGDGERFQHWGIQLRVRSSTDALGSVKAHYLRRFLDEEIYSRTVTLDNASYVVHCFANTSLQILGRETPASKRYLHTINTLVSLRRTV